MSSRRLIASKWFRLALSLLLVVHLLAIFLPPLSFQTRGPLGPSPSVSMVLRPLEHYGQFLYIDRGYAFFAPDPGPSHLIQAAVTDPQGNRREVMFPDRNQQWPRLLYHRHFMLTEYLNEIYQPPFPEGEMDALGEQESQYWRQSRARYEHFRHSLVHHLESVHPECEVAIRRLEHLIPDLVGFRERPVSLTDPNSYRVLLDQPVELAGPPLAEPVESLPEAIPAPSLSAPSSSPSSAVENRGRSDAVAVPGGAP